jgi:NADPH-dependent glutamate synthase beta subunit-like oxidoreductase
MGKPTGFMEYDRRDRRDRRYEPAADRVVHYREFVIPLSDGELAIQGARCMDCGIPFCHQGCPVNNLIPDWNDLVYKGDWQAAIEVLHSTNNFPEFTGRICPAPCESAVCCALFRTRGVPDFKLAKHLIDRRQSQMRTEGVEFHTHAHVDKNIPIAKLRQDYDALVLAGGSEQPIDLPIPGRDLEGIHFAMDFLTRNSKRVQGSYITPSPVKVAACAHSSVSACCYADWAAVAALAGACRCRYGSPGADWSPRSPGG